MPEVLRGEVWYASLDPVEGHEQGGERPCLVVSNNHLNRSAADLVVVLPLTSQPRNLPTRIPLALNEAGTTMQSYVICEHVRTISKTRLRRRCGEVTPATMQRVQVVLRQILSLDTRR